MYAGYRPDSVASRLIMSISILRLFRATFWIGLVLIFTFAVQLGWLPAGNRGETATLFGVEWSFLTPMAWKHMLLPALNLSLFKFAMMCAPCPRRHPRDHADRHRALRPRCGGERIHHPPAACAAADFHPIVTVFGLEFGSTMAFAVVTETIFSWPGVGKLIIDSISSLDRPVMVAYLMLVAFFFIVINLLVDLSMPRSIRACARGGRHDGRDTPCPVLERIPHEQDRGLRTVRGDHIILIALSAPLIAPQNPYDLANSC